MTRRWMVLPICLLLLIAGCSGSMGGANIWIDVPLNPTTLAEVQTVVIEGHASSPEGVEQIEVWVNGNLIETIGNPTSVGSLASFESQFTPAGPGEYTIQVVARGIGGEVSEPDSTIVLIGESQAASPEDDDSPTPTPPPTPTPVPDAEANEPTINYYAEPAEINAGACTTLYWETTNVSKVEFGGTTQPLTGSYHDCMCETQTYPLTVTYEDSSKETFHVTVSVTGTCETATPTFTPPPDTTAPPAPNQLKPINGSTLPSSTSEVILRWEAVSDPSGIEEYRVQVQRHPGDNNWKTIAGSPFIVHGDTNQTIPSCASSVSRDLDWQWDSFSAARRGSHSRPR